MRKLGKNDLSMSFKEKSDMSRDFHLSRLTGWQREVANKSRENFVLPFVLCLERCEYFAKLKTIVVPAVFDEKILNKNIELIWEVLGDTVFVITKQNLARKLADEYCENAHFELKEIAKAEGWHGFFWSYLMSTALTQAQFMTGANVAYTVPPHLTTGKESALRIKAYLKDCKEKAEMGAIKVLFSNEIIDAMKTQRVRSGE